MAIRHGIFSKYRLVGSFLREVEATGSVLDMGARDRILSKYLPSTLTYISADRDPGCDYTIDLEATSLTFGPGPCNTVIALDVLEHVDKFHQAFRNLASLAQDRLIIALPNLAYIWHRFSFLFTGRLATDKYDLSAEERLDRHRWLTSYRDIASTVSAIGRVNGFEVEVIINEIGSGTFSRLILFPLAKLGLPICGWASGRVIVVLKRQVAVANADIESTRHYAV